MSGRLFFLFARIPNGAWIYLLVILLCPSCSWREQSQHREAAFSLPPPSAVLQQQEESKLPAQEPKGYLTLDAAIDEALKANPELIQITQRITAAAEQVAQAEASFYPRLVLSGDFNITDNPVFALMHIINQRRLEPNVNFNDPGEQQNFGSKAQAEWVLFQGGSRWHERKAAMAMHRSTEAELKAGRNQLVSKVTETYYRWLSALSFIGVAERALGSAMTDHQIGEARGRAQMALPSELLRLKVRVSEAQENLLTARTGARKLQAALERLIARPIGSEEIPGPALALSLESMPPASDADSASLVRQALSNRPEMASVKALIQSAEERVKSAKGGLLPRLGANAQYEVDSEKLDGSADSWMLGLQASWPIFEGGVSMSRIREAKARLKEIEARGKQIELDIALEVNQAALALEEASEKARVADERSEWAEQALDEVRNLYRNEVAGVDSLLQAELAWNRAEVSRTAALFEARIAQALLRKSLGDFADGMLTEESK